VFHQIITPDLDFSDLETAISSTEETIRSICDKYSSLGPIFLLGHSLGGILAAVTAKSLGKDLISKVVIIASPYGESVSGDRSIKFQRFLIHHSWLLPGFLTRPRFFTKKFTPKKIQKDLWGRVVKESPRFIDEIIAKKSFHTDIITGKLPQRSLVIASRNDRVVPFMQTQRFAEVIGAETLTFDNVGHDDLIFGPTVAEKVVEGVIGFLLGKEFTTKTSR